MATITTLKCEQCGTRLVVTEDMESHLSPIYCCGLEVEKISSAVKKPAKPKKKTAKKKPAKKKKTAAKKKKGRK